MTRQVQKAEDDTDDKRKEGWVQMSAPLPQLNSTAAHFLQQLSALCSLCSLLHDSAHFALHYKNTLHARRFELQ